MDCLWRRKIKSIVDIILRSYPNDQNLGEAGLVHGIASRAELKGQWIESKQTRIKLRVVALNNPEMAAIGMGRVD